MTWRRFLGIRHQPDQWPSVHERARTRAAERLDWPLEPVEEAWLVDHLATCAACAATAAEYEAQRSELRLLREGAPPPPRDLWARTSAAIEAQAPGARAARRPTRPPSRLPLGAISGVLVVAVVVGASLLSQPSPFPQQSPSALTASSTSTAPSALATPIVIPTADDVGWVEVDQSGDADVLMAPIDEVCADGRTTGCAPIDGASERSLKLGQTPVAIVRSPAEGELIVVDHAEDSQADIVYAVPAPTATARPSTSATPSAEPTITPAPTLSQEPTPSVEPTAPPASDEPTISPPPNESTAPTVSPSPPVEGAIAIATDVLVVGDSAAYSPDGRWFAFSARPADGSTGPDVYVWRSGQAVAVPLTTDHRTVFASWLGDGIIASRAIGVAQPPTAPESSGDLASTEPSDSPAADDEPIASPDPDDASGSADPSASPAANSFLSEIVYLDPATGIETRLGAGPWRPSVSPAGSAAVYWDGELTADANGVAFRPASGNLVLGGWPLAASDREPQVLDPRSIVDWDARWDASGSRLAVWVADPADLELGSLSLYVIDPETARLEPGERPLVDVPARRGFSLAGGRLAWVTPAGQDGEGSRVQVLAWNEGGFGQVETLPGRSTIVVIR
jgi:hypothetical protein